jgi:hypothetical protein
VRLTLKAINEELAKRRVGARLAKGDGYFYFSGGEASDWLGKTVNAPSLSSLSLEQWITELERLTKLNAEILKASAGEGRAEVKRPPTKRRRGKR